MAKKSSLPFDKRGGTVVIQRRLLSSPEYLALTAQAKVLLTLLQRHWTPAGPVGFGVRQAEEEIPCSRTLALRAFKELEQAGFIALVDESLFCSRTQSKTRTWRLTWLPCWRNRAPTNEWEGRQVSISTGP
ncbi:helix-turn-helix domain-containing protein [Pseudomonas sp. PDM33]|uniref:helix-turn-helix domain-containing protein n=1 Tax=Pseudomonas sp. PDM33 TaxID=2854765 RepID=UPI001C466CEA|nr:helix-turn-helix domain-containing protein [Pseudomonas sp. PDM33]MBV7586875.1 helix-turn-helix domain-containing protein [Pseudomonas sp. PDM33]